jgi:hypothetical protein
VERHGQRARHHVHGEGRSEGRRQGIGVRWAHAETRNSAADSETLLHAWLAVAASSALQEHETALAKE